MLVCGGWGEGLLFENCIVDASILFLLPLRVVVPLGGCVERDGDAENDIFS